MAGALQSLIDVLSKAFTNRAAQLRGVMPPTDFFSAVSSTKALLDLFKRDSYVEKLKGLDQKTHSMKEWVAAKQPAEFMAGLERDTRAHLRSRLDHYRAAAGTKLLPPIYFDRFRSMIEKLEAN